MAALDTNCSYCMQPFQQGKLQGQDWQGRPRLGPGPLCVFPSSQHPRPSSFPLVYLESLPMARYHPACFRCTTCKELLAGTFVMFLLSRGGHVNAGRRVRRTRAQADACAAVCATCPDPASPLSGLQVFIKDGGIYCERHFSDLYKARSASARRPCPPAPPALASFFTALPPASLPHRCFACDESICEAQFLQAEGRPWHMKHFCCYECGRQPALRACGAIGAGGVPQAAHPHASRRRQTAQGRPVRPARQSPALHALL